MDIYIYKTHVQSMLKKKKLYTSIETSVLDIYRKKKDSKGWICS